jgi:hypothetical protein
MRAARSSSRSRKRRTHNPFEGAEEALDTSIKGGIRNKARRGELFVRPTMGFVFNTEAKLVLDPDQQVQQSVRLLFETLRRTGLAMATVKYFGEQGAARRYGTPQRRSRMGRLGAQPGVAHPPQPEIHGSLCVWQNSYSQDGRWPLDHRRCATRRMGSADTGSARRLQSAGMSTNKTSVACMPTARPMGRIAARVRHAKAPHCCKTSSSAAGAASA